MTVSDRIHVATKKGLFTLARRAAGWAIERHVFPGDHVTMVLDDGETVWAGMGLGHFGPKIRRSDDGGKAYVDVATPAHPTPPAPATGGAAPTSGATGMIWALEKAAGRLWCGALPGGLFTSTDGGASWSLVESLWNHPWRAEWMGGGADDPGIHTVLIDPRDPARVTLGVSTGGVWRSEDAGASWDLHGKGLWAAFMPPDRKDDPRVQDVHRMAQCRAVPDVVWLQHHNGAFRSTDGARTFTELTFAPSTFGFAVAAHPKDPDTAWYVPAQKDEFRIPVDAKLVVAKTTDGGATFRAITKGLPSSPAYDLVYRHALDVDATGDRLAFGSTTGGVWTSDDGGESWTILDARLPPITTLRFAPR